MNCSERFSSSRRCYIEDFLASKLDQISDRGDTHRDSMLYKDFLEILPLQVPHCLQYSSGVVVWTNCLDCNGIMIRTKDPLILVRFLILYGNVLKLGIARYSSSR